MKRNLIQHNANRSGGALSCNSSPLVHTFHSIQSCSAHKVILNGSHATDEEDGDNQKTPRYINCSAQYALAANAVYMNL
ncbi:unnamed protein product, partial [Phytomonas sp. Hart1]